MAMVTNSTLTRAWTVSADHLLISYDFTSPASDGIKSWSTGQIGHASVALSPNEKVIATGGWDGRIRLFSASTGKPLGELSYHRESVHILAFANTRALKDFGLGAEGNEVESTIEIGEEGSDSEQADESAEFRERWLVSGGKDRRVALWSLMDFDR
jgi:WD40 repeat protein